MLDGSSQPATGTMHYSAVGQNPLQLAPGVDATATAADDITDAGGHFAPMLFGPSAITFSIDGSGRAIRSPSGPGHPITLHLADQSGGPGAPQNVAATAGDRKVKVTWDAPASDGGSPITGYTVTASHGSSNFRANFGAGVTSGAIRGLVNGKTYSVIVVATNANGAGAASDPVTVTLDAVAPPTTTTTAPGSGGARNGGGALAAGSGDDGGQAPLRPRLGPVRLLAARRRRRRLLLRRRRSPGRRLGLAGRHAPPGPPTSSPRRRGRATGSSTAPGTSTRSATLPTSATSSPPGSLPARVRPACRPRRRGPATGSSPTGAG